MKLKFYKSISESQITVSLSLTNLTVNERKAIKILGAPKITLEKTYNVSDTSVLIDTDVTSFSEEYTFKGTTDNIYTVIEEVNTFVTDVQEVITEAMSTLMASYRDIEKSVASQAGELEIADEENTSSKE